jgi:hypothetical protein
MTTLEQEVGELQARIECLEAKVGRLAGDEGSEVLPTLGDPVDQVQLLVWLKAERLVRDPTSEERHLAAEWDTLPEEEKQAHIRFMHRLVLEPPLSQILIENRR